MGSGKPPKNRPTGTGVLPGPQFLACGFTGVIDAEPSDDSAKAVSGHLRLNNERVLVCHNDGTILAQVTDADAVPLLRDCLRRLYEYDAWTVDGDWWRVTIAPKRRT